MFPLAFAGDWVVGVFAATAAVVLVGGSVLLRWQRNKLQFALMQTALERGTTLSQGMPPFWLISLRQGFSVLTLGIGLLLVGGVVAKRASLVAMPEISSIAVNSTTLPAVLDDQEQPLPGQPGFGPPPVDGRGRRGEMRGQEDGPPDDGPPQDQRPPAGGLFGRPRPAQGPGGRPNPPLERWHRAQDQRAVGMIAAGSGAVLILLGLVRIAFARIERKYVEAAI